MNKLLLVISVVFLSLSLSGQKIKLKKDEIQIDKVPVLKILKTYGEGFNPEKGFVLLAMTGDTVAKFEGHAAFFERLPHEEEPRTSHYFMDADFRTLGKQMRLDYTPVFFKRYMIQVFKATKAVGKEGLIPELMDEFLGFMGVDSIQMKFDTLAAINLRRIGNAKRCTESFGEIAERKPGRIKYEDNFLLDGRRKVAHITVKKRTSYGTLYSIKKVYRLKVGKEIGTVFHTAKDGRIYFRFLGGTAVSGFEKFLSIGPASSETVIAMGTHLVNEGFL
jgi:hypothetical protein